MNKLEFLGRGSGYNVKEGNTSAYIRKNETLLLIDCGEDIFKTIVEKAETEGFKVVNII